MISSLILGLVGFQSRDIDAYTQPALKDLRFTVKLVQSSIREAVKIDKDYQKNFSLQNGTVQLKEPFMLRIDAKADDTQITFLLNGGRQMVRIPKIGLKQRTDLTNEPGRRQTFNDFGILTPSVAKEFFISKFVRFDRETGDAIFDLTWPAKYDNTTRFRVWIDKEGKHISKREWYDQIGRLRATSFYSEVMKEGGVAFPTEMKVFNAENKQAAHFKYENVKINDGVSDSLFDF